jgi:PAS domain S-box-containing protein
VRVANEQTLHTWGDSMALRDGNGKVVGQGWNVMVTLWDGKGTVGWLAVDNLLQQKPLTDSDLEILKLYSLALGNLCAQKRTEDELRAERNLLRTIIDILPDRIFVKDTQSRLLLVNKASWMHTPNVSGEEEMIGMTDTDLMPAELAEQIYADERELFANGQPIQNREEPGRDYQGNPIYFLSTKVPLRDAQGNITGLVGVSRDITNQKQAEQQRLELALQKERLELLTEFIGNMSHDLKTPLSVIKTTLYLMERLDDPTRQKAKLQVIKEQTLRLEKLIQDVITMSRLEHGAKPMFELVDFNMVILDVEAKLRPTAERKHLNIRLNLNADLPSLPADENELWRLMANLYENALHYTPEHGTITLTTYFAEKKVVVEVQDTGMGIDKDDMPYIFDRFYRADPARSIERGGTGLGLAIVKRIVELHGGEIVVQSDEGQGSLFRVLLPLTGLK